jgi:hypothetical protein
MGSERADLSRPISGFVGKSLVFTRTAQAGVCVCARMQIFVLIIAL